jgi:hypothetical protein
MNGAQVCVHALPAAPCAAAGPIHQHRQNLAIYSRATLSLFLWVRDGSKIEIPSALFGAPLSTARNKTLFGKEAERRVRATAREKERATGLALILTSIMGAAHLSGSFLKYAPQIHHSVELKCARIVSGAGERERERGAPARTAF